MAKQPRNSKPEPERVPVSQDSQPSPVAVEVVSEPEPVSSGDVLEPVIDTIPPKSLARMAYELMVSKFTNSDVSFQAWDEMEPFLRKVFEDRAASLAADGLFEQCVKEIQASA